MIRWFIVFIMLILCININAQKHNIEHFIINIDSLIENKKYNLAIKMLDEIESECISSNNNRLIASFYFKKAISLYLSQSYRECIPLFEKAYNFFEKSKDLNTEYLECFTNIGNAYLEIGYNESNAIKFYRKGLIKSFSMEENSFVYDKRATIIYNIGKIYAENEEPYMSIECLNELNYITSQYSQTYIEALLDVIIEKLSHSALTLNMNSQFVDSVLYYDQILEILKKYKGVSDESYILYAYTKALIIYQDLGLYDEAIPLFEELISIGNKLETYNADICGAYCFYIMCLSHAGYFTKVDYFLQKGKYYIGLANLDIYMPHMLYRFAGNGAYAKQDYKKAILYYEQYLDSRNPKEGANNYDEIVNMISVAYIMNNVPDKAEKLLLNYLRNNETEIKAKDLQLLSDIYHNLGHSIMLQGNNSKALKYLNRSKEIQLKINGKVKEITLLYIQKCL